MNQKSQRRIRYEGKSSQKKDQVTKTKEEPKSKKTREEFDGEQKKAITKRSKIKYQEPILDSDEEPHEEDLKEVEAESIPLTAEQLVIIRQLHQIQNPVDQINEHEKEESKVNETSKNQEADQSNSGDQSQQNNESQSVVEQLENLQIQEQQCACCQQPIQAPQLDMNCVVCREVVPQSELRQETQTRRNRAYECDRCEEKIIHERCMDEDEREIFELDEFWLCEQCVNDINDEPSSSEFSYNSQSENLQAVENIHLPGQIGGQLQTVSVRIGNQNIDGAIHMEQHHFANTNGLRVQVDVATSTFNGNMPDLLRSFANKIREHNQRQQAQNGNQNNGQNASAQTD